MPTDPPAPGSQGPQEPHRPHGHLADNVMLFARVLRSAGLPVGSDRVQLALQALQLAGLESKRDFHAVLRACLLDRIEHGELFDQAFALFWRDPDALVGLHSLGLAATVVKVRGGATRSPEAQRADDTRFPHEAEGPATVPREGGPDLDALPSWTDHELLRGADFDAMTADEWREAQRLLAQMRLIFEPLPTRRARPAVRPGRPDWRATLAAMARRGGQWGDMRWRAPRERPAPLVVLADISGSMSRYSRMLLHFAHALGHAEARVESFVFGTRLTRTTRLLRRRDPDIAVAQVVHEVQDWSGGTRIATSLREFNQRWARRVLSSRATLLLISDGLEHGDTRALAAEMERLHKSCRRLIWLNPLLRFDRFEPRAGSIRAMLPHVDRFLPAHNLHSLSALVQVLARQDVPGRAPGADAARHRHGSVGLGKAAAQPRESRWP